MPERAGLGSLQGDSELPQAAQPSCCPTTAVGRESPSLKLASSSPPRQFYHSLWQTGPCSEVMTGSPSASGHEVRGRQRRATCRSPIMVSLRLGTGKTHEKQEPLCAWSLTLLRFCFPNMTKPIGTPCPLLNSGNTKKRKAKFY